MENIKRLPVSRHIYTHQAVLTLLAPLFNKVSFFSYPFSSEVSMYTFLRLFLHRAVAMREV